jgi:hypothetical protein
VTRLKWIAFERRDNANHVELLLAPLL